MSSKGHCSWTWKVGDTRKQSCSFVLHIRKSSKSSLGPKRFYYQEQFLKSRWRSSVLHNKNKWGSQDLAQSYNRECWQVTYIYLQPWLHFLRICKSFRKTIFFLIHEKHCIQVWFWRLFLCRWKWGRNGRRKRHDCHHRVYNLHWQGKGNNNHIMYI